MNNQEIKADAGKPQLTLIPRQILYDIARVREYGVQKYGKSESWKEVEIERYRDATFRHFLAYLDNPQGVDEESGLTHLSHLACNIAFLCELEKEQRAKKEQRVTEGCNRRKIKSIFKVELLPVFSNDLSELKDFLKDFSCNIIKIDGKDYYLSGVCQDRITFVEYNSGEHEIEIGCEL